MDFLLFNSSNDLNCDDNNWSLHKFDIFLRKNFLCFEILFLNKTAFEYFSRNSFDIIFFFLFSEFFVLSFDILLKDEKLSNKVFSFF